MNYAVTELHSTTQAVYYVLKSQFSVKQENYTLEARGTYVLRVQITAVLFIHKRHKYVCTHARTHIHTNGTNFVTCKIQNFTPKSSSHFKDLFDINKNNCVTKILNWASVDVHYTPKEFNTKVISMGKRNDK